MINFAPISPKNLRKFGNALVTDRQQQKITTPANPATTPTKIDNTNSHVCDKEVQNVVEDSQVSNPAPRPGPSNNALPLYPGDEKDDSGPLELGEEDRKAIGEQNIRSDGFAKLDFPHPAFIVALYDENVRSQKVLLHPWQLEVAEQLAAAKPNDQHPYKFCLCACNGSGKDLYVIAPFAVWFALTKIKSRCIITSSSGTQLTSQTETYIKTLCERVNEFHGQQIFRIRQRYIKCMLSGSEIRLFATDEAGKAEGYHPLEPGAEMAIIVNEAKSVAEEIFGALRRCTGFNYWLNISTPGEPSGDFYKSFTRWPHKRHVTTFDCVHLSPSEREEDKIELGEHSALYRSKHLALFTSLGGTVIIPLEVINRCEEARKKGLIPWVKQSDPIAVGGDLAAGGDELVITARRGNKIINRWSLRERDTELAADWIHNILKHKLGLDKKHEYLYFDDGGVGHAIVDKLVRRGWVNISRIHNQSAASNKKEFKHRGAEGWFRIARLFEECLFITDGDPKLLEQLSNRYYKKTDMDKIGLESKADAKANGRPSPDRADSLILSLTGVTVDDFLPAIEVAQKSGMAGIVESTGRISKKLASNKELEEWMEEKAYGEYEGKSNMMKSRGKKPRGSLGVLFANN